MAQQEPPADAPGPGAGVGLYHAAFEVADPEALAALAERVRARGVDLTPVDHGISKALYFADSSGNGLEAYVDTRDDPEGTWGGKNRPLKLSDAKQ